jgi:hypothetical protein
MLTTTSRAAVFLWHGVDAAPRCARSRARAAGLAGSGATLTVLTGFGVNGLGLAGFAVAGFVVAGFVVTGFVVTGFVVTGFVLTVVRAAGVGVRLVAGGVGVADPAVTLNVTGAVRCGATAPAVLCPPPERNSVTTVNNARTGRAYARHP